MKALIMSLAVSSVLLLAAAPAAEAHERGYKAHHVHHDYGYYYHRPPMPHWLKRHKGFKRWYRHVNIRHKHRIGWRDLYSIYRYEVRWGKPHRKYYRKYRYGDRYYGRHRDHRDDWYDYDDYYDDDRSERRRKRKG